MYLKQEKYSSRAISQNIPVFFSYTDFEDIFCCVNDKTEKIVRKALYNK